MKVYLSGPMTGYPDFNYPAFHERAAAWRKEGWDVFNPAETADGDTSKLRAYYLRIDLREIVDVDAVAVLPNWQKSKGASLEVAIARELELPIYDAETFALYQETVCQEAQRLVYGDRGASYGHPREDFARTGKMWAAILGVDGITPSQVALCMIALKLSRHTYQPKHDNITDIAGYAECLYRIEET